MLKYSYLTDRAYFCPSFVCVLFCLVFCLTTFICPACHTVIGQIYDCSFALLPYTAIHWPDVRWLASFDDCLKEDASSQMTCWGVTSLSLVIRWKIPCHLFNQSKVKQGKTVTISDELRHIFPSLACTCYQLHAFAFWLVLVSSLLFLAILSSPAKNKNCLCHIAVTRLSIVFYEFLLSPKYKTQ